MTQYSDGFRDRWFCRNLCCFGRAAAPKLQFTELVDTFSDVWDGTSPVTCAGVSLREPKRMREEMNLVALLVSDLFYNGSELETLCSAPGA